MRASGARDFGSIPDSSTKFMDNSPLVVAFGGGVNSTALLVGLSERNILPDLVLFADTGGEKPQTYEFVELMRTWTAAVFGHELVVVHASKRTDNNLEENCLRLGTLPSIVYGHRTCSQRWKLEPCEKYMNHWRPALKAWKDGIQVRNAKGIDAGEQHRAKDFSDKRYRVIYPLIEWGWDRKQCVDAIHRAGLPVPVKSACFFCPSSKKSEVVQLKKDNPDLFARAVAMEHAASEKLVNIRGLGRHWSWEEVANAEEAQFKMFPETVPIPCMCFDGDDDA